MKEDKNYKASKRDWTLEARWFISKNLAKYYNNCLDNKKQLSHNHNIAR